MVLDSFWCVGPFLWWNIDDRDVLWEGDGRRRCYEVTVNSICMIVFSQTSVDTDGMA